MHEKVVASCTFFGCKSQAHLPVAWDAAILESEDPGRRTGAGAGRVYLGRTRGSHHQYRQPTKPGVVTVAGKPADDLAPGTLNSILKQAGLKW